MTSPRQLASATPGPTRASRGERLLPWLLLPLALLPDLGAAWPRDTYYFRDFSLTFYPLRLFQARELAAGRWPSWNPFVHEGTFALPVLYPFDLLHVLAPDPAFVSWLLTLHLPFAALAAYALGRELRLSPAGAFATATVYALGGFALSCLNLYVFLQALAWAPLVVLGLRRAALRGGPWIAAAALAVALGLSTLALELVAQALVVGLLLSWSGAHEERPAGTRPARGLARAAAALVLGTGLAGVPVLLAFEMLRDSPRGAGFDAATAAGFALPPVGLAQTLVASLFGAVDRPLQVWWGGRFFPGGFPYFASLYVGPLAAALAVTGLPVLPRRTRLALVGAAGLALVYALGPDGGLWSLARDWPLLRVFRFPSKALFTPHLAAALLCGCGLERLRAQPRAWRGFGVAAAVAGLFCAALAAAPFAVSSAALADWLGLDGHALQQLRAELPADAARSALVAALGVALSLATLARGLASARAAALLTAVLALDLARAGAGLNPQVRPDFFDLLPALAHERLDRLDGGRVYAVPPLHSPAFRAWLQTRPPGVGAAAFYLDRQILDPFTNTIDSVETAASVDRTGFLAQAPQLAPGEHSLARLAHALPRLRQAAVTRVLAFDALALPDLRLRTRVSVPGTPLLVHVYELARPWPRAYVACRVIAAGSRAQAAATPYRAGFDPRGDLALETLAEPTPPLSASACGTARARLLAQVPGRELYAAESDAAAWLLVRASWARGWRASVDGRPAAVRRANGRHRAVALPAGRHVIEMRYVAPGLRAGLLVTSLSLAATAALLGRGRGGRRRRALTGTCQGAAAVKRTDRAALPSAAVHDTRAAPPSDALEPGAASDALPARRSAP